MNRARLLEVVQLALDVGAFAVSFWLAFDASAASAEAIGRVTVFIGGGIALRLLLPLQHRQRGIDVDAIRNLLAKHERRQ